MINFRFDLSIYMENLSKSVQGLVLRVVVGNVYFFYMTLTEFFRWLVVLLIKDDLLLLLIVLILIVGSNWGYGYLAYLVIDNLNWDVRWDWILNNIIYLRD
jgi:hypothetical protein